MRLQVYHRTEYIYTEAVTNSSNEVRLTPKITRTQEVELNLLSVLPATRLKYYNDLNFNRVHYFTVPYSHHRLVIDSRFIVHTRKPFELDALPYGLLHTDLPKYASSDDCHTFLQNSDYIEVTPEIWRQAVDIRGDSMDVFETSYAVMDYIYNNYNYHPDATTVSTHASDVIQGCAGVCQDFAHAMAAFCRALGIPARYVSGYFFDNTRGHALRGSEASHAWVEVYVGEQGWIGLDPTNRKVVDDTYIILAFGRDYRDVAPVIGTYFGGSHSKLNICVEVDQLDA